MKATVLALRLSRLALRYRARANAIFRHAEAQAGVHQVDVLDLAKARC